MYSTSPRRHRHRKRARHSGSMTPAPTPVPTGMFWLPHGTTVPPVPLHYMPQYPVSNYESIESSSDTTSDQGDSSDDADADMNGRPFAKKMLAELQWIRQSTESLLKRQSDLERKLEQYLKAANASSTAAASQSKLPPSKSKQFSSSRAPSNNNNASSYTPSAKAKTLATDRMMRRKGKDKVSTSQLAEAIFRKSNVKKDPARKPTKVVKNHILRLIASQPGYGQSLEKAIKGYEKLLNIGRDEVTAIQKALGTPGVCPTTFGKEEVRPHRVKACANLERLALARVSPKIDLSACPDSWAADYLLRRVWEAITARQRENEKYRTALQQKKKVQESSSDGDDEQADERSGSFSEDGDDVGAATSHSKRVPEVRSAT